MSSTVVLTPHELQERRRELLLALNMSYEEAEQRAADFMLSEQERSIWEAIDGIDFLLSDG